MNETKSTKPQLILQSLVQASHSLTPLLKDENFLTEIKKSAHEIEVALDMHKASRNQYEKMTKLDRHRVMIPNETKLRLVNLYEQYLKLNSEQIKYSECIEQFFQECGKEKAYSVFPQMFGPNLLEFSRALSAIAMGNDSDKYYFGPLLKYVECSQALDTELPEIVTFYEDRVKMVEELLADPKRWEKF